MSDTIYGSYRRDPTASSVVEKVSKEQNASNEKLRQTIRDMVNLANGRGFYVKSRIFLVPLDEEKREKAAV